jgi:hypothetical protein
MAHETQAPLQAALQHTPSIQNPLAQAAPVVQATPIGASGTASVWASRPASSSAPASCVALASARGASNLPASRTGGTVVHPPVSRA